MTRGHRRRREDCRKFHRVEIEPPIYVVDVRQVGTRIGFPWQHPHPTESFEVIDQFSVEESAVDVRRTLESLLDSWRHHLALTVPAAFEIATVTTTKPTSKVDNAEFAWSIASKCQPTSINEDKQSHQTKQPLPTTCTLSDSVKEVSQTVFLRKSNLLKRMSSALMVSTSGMYKTAVTVPYWISWQCLL